MKLTVEAIVFSTGTYTRPSDGTESRYLRLKAATTSGKVATYTFWDSMASALETTLNNYVPEGMSLADIRLLLSLDGEFHEEKSGGRSFRTKGFSVLAGPAAELHRVRNGAMAAMATARAAAERGAFQEAYGTLLRQFENLTRANEVEAPTDGAEVSPPVPEAQPAADAVPAQPTEQPPIVSERANALPASVAAIAAPEPELTATFAPRAGAVLVSPPAEPAAPEPAPSIREEPKPVPPVARLGLGGFGRGRFGAAPAATASAVEKPAAPAAVTPRPPPPSPTATVTSTAPARSPASRGGLSLSREQQANKDYSQEPAPSVASSGLARPPQSVSGAPRSAARRGGLSFE